MRFSHLKYFRYNIFCISAHLSEHLSYVMARNKRNTFFQTPTVQYRELTGLKLIRLEKGREFSFLLTKPCELFFLKYVLQLQNPYQLELLPLARFIWVRVEPFSFFQQISINIFHPLVKRSESHISTAPSVFVLFCLVGRGGWLAFGWKGIKWRDCMQVNMFKEKLEQKERKSKNFRKSYLAKYFLLQGN